MECPKCHKIISDNETVCPHCRKVLSLICPNCHTLNKQSVCSKCGYIILEKCSKCGRLTPTTESKCKCGFDTSASIANNECETDEFASITLKIRALSAIRNLLASQELYAKFSVKLRNLILSQLKGLDGNIILYGDTYVINFNKELSFITSVNKAIRTSLKIMNAFSGLNLRMQDELGTPLKINLIIHKKNANELLINKTLNNNVKLLMVRKDEQKHLKGMQIILDQYTRDCIEGNFKTDSLYSLEQDGITVMYYELLLENYILPPDKNDDSIVIIQKRDYEKAEKVEEENENIYGFKVFDIKAKCNFRSYSSEELSSKINSDYKIVALRGEKELQISISDLKKIYEKDGKKVIYVSCSEELKYKPWGIFEKIFKQYYNLSIANGLITKDVEDNRFNVIKDFITGQPINATTSEDARFACMEMFVQFLKFIKNHVIIIDGFEFLDDTSIQTISLYFNKFKNINNNFIFITDTDTAVHSKIQGLLQTPHYTEVVLLKNSIETLLSGIKEDAEDFIQSFYYEKIKENFNGSKLYFDNALRFLADKNVLINFENKLIIKNSGSFILPKNLSSLVRTRLKTIVKNQDASMILAYSVFLGERLDFKVLETLGIKDVTQNAEFLQNTGFTYTKDDAIFINNYNLMKSIFKSSLKKEVEEFLAKNIIAKLGKVIDNTTLVILMKVVGLYKEEYLLLWKNSQTAIQSGDYDAYLTNCLGFLSVVEKTANNIPPETLEENKKEVYQNILMSLYGYSPDKIYSIENVLLTDAIQKNDNEKVMKLSNLMLQGALIASNYSESLSLLHNILSRIENPSLIVNGSINTKYLLLSLVNIEILFNIGNYKQCIEIGEEVLKVLKPKILENIKPANFSTNFFVSHLMETFRNVGFAKLLTCDENIDLYFNNIKKALNEDLPEKECILAVKEFLSGKKFAPSGTEEASAFSKVIFLILRELSDLKNNYKLFAQNIYQAKLLASDLHQIQLEYLCDMLIAYAYSKVGISRKANYIYNDLLQKAESSAIFNIIILVRYLIAKDKIHSDNIEEALLIINDTLAELQKNKNEAKVFYAMFEKLYINIAIKYKLPTVNIQTEQHKLEQVSPNGELERIVKQSEFISPEPEIEIAPVREEPELDEEYNGEGEENTPEDNLGEITEDIDSREEKTAE